MPSSGKFRPFGFKFLFPDERNFGIFEIGPYQDSDWMKEHPDSKPYALRDVSVRVFRRGTDVAHDNYLMYGTAEEVLTYLESKECFDEMRDSLRELSGEVDRYWEEHEDEL